MSNNPFFNPNGKVFEIIVIDYAHNSEWYFMGILGIAISFFIFFQSSPSLIAVLVVVLGLTVSCRCIWFGLSKKDKIMKYIIDSKYNTFFIPFKDEPYYEPYCKLSGSSRILVEFAL
jgi:hypothetical protein